MRLSTRTLEVAETLVLKVWNFFLGGLSVAEDAQQEKNEIRIGDHHQVEEILYEQRGCCPGRRRGVIAMNHRRRTWSR